MKVTVIGAGKMGLPLAAVFASRGATVIAADADSNMVATINRGQAPFDEPGLSELMREMVGAHRLSATTNNREAIAGADVCVVLVPVMLDATKGADLRIIRSIAADLAVALRKGAMVAFETTLPVGETRRLGAIIEGGRLKLGRDFALVFSPERVKSRFVLRNLQVNPKIVGGASAADAARGEEFYSRYLGGPVINVGSLEAAEFVKLAGMVYRDVNIALANELAWYSHALGIDFQRVVEAANTDGEAALLSPGIGVGGHCTPVYPYFLIRDAESRGIDVGLTAAARKLNESQPAKLVSKLGNIRGKEVLVLGLAFRPEVKEAAYSPAFGLRDELTRRGAVVKLHDPLFTSEEIAQHGFEAAAPDGQEIIILNTAHQDYRGLDFQRLRESGTRTVVDGRNFLDPERVRASGLEYIGISRGAAANETSATPEGRPIRT